MPEFKKKKDMKKDCVPKRDLFGKLKDSKARLEVKEANLLAPVLPKLIVEAAKKIDAINSPHKLKPSARMCVGDKFMTFEFDFGGKIQVDNETLKIRCTSLNEESIRELNSRLALTANDWIIVRNEVF